MEEIKGIRAHSREERKAVVYKLITLWNKKFTDNFKKSRTDSKICRICLYSELSGIGTGNRYLSGSFSQHRGVIQAEWNSTIHG